MQDPDKQTCDLYEDISLSPVSEMGPVAQSTETTFLESASQDRNIIL